ncbi:MAG: hypothetical protein ACI9Y1_003190 [Lentisphaeria bacterium]|jgi:hypothetical protein
MVKDMAYGLAWSAFVLGIFYLASAYLLIKLASKPLRLIAEVFVARRNICFACGSLCAGWTVDRGHLGNRGCRLGVGRAPPVALLRFIFWYHNSVCRRMLVSGGYKPR